MSYESKFAPTTNKGKAIAQIQAILGNSGLNPVEKDYTNNNGFAKIGSAAKGGQYDSIFAAFAAGHRKFLLLEDQTLPYPANDTWQNAVIAADGLTADFSSANNTIDEHGLVVGLAVGCVDGNGGGGIITAIDTDTNIVTFDRSIFHAETTLGAEGIVYGLLLDGDESEVVFRGLNKSIKIIGAYDDFKVTSSLESLDKNQTIQIAGCTGSKGTTALTGEAIFGSVTAGDYLAIFPKGDSPLSTSSTVPIKVASVTNADTLVLEEPLPFDISTTADTTQAAMYGRIDNSTVYHYPAATHVDMVPIIIENLTMDVVEGFVNGDDVAYSAYAEYNDVDFINKRPFYNNNNAGDYVFNRCTFAVETIDAWLGLNNAVLEDCIFELPAAGSEHGSDLHNCVFRRCTFNGDILNNDTDWTIDGCVFESCTFTGRFENASNTTAHGNTNTFLNSGRAMTGKKPFTGYLILHNGTVAKDVYFENGLCVAILDD